MADNVAVTAGTGTVIAADEVTRNAIAEKQQIIKISLGAEGAFDNLVDSGQQLSAASVPVVIASDQSAVPITGTVTAVTAITNALPAGTNNIGDVDVLSSALPTGASTAAKQPALGTAGAPSTDVITIQGIAAGTTVPVTGTITAVTAITNALPAGTNNIGDVDVLTLPALVAGTANIGDVDVLTLPNVTLAAGTNTNEVVGDAAHDAAVAGNPLLQGIEARTSLGTAVANGDVVRATGDRYGRAFVMGFPMSWARSNGTPITATTTSVIAAPGAGSHLEIGRIHMTNASATAATVSIRDGAAGTQSFESYLPQGGIISVDLAKSGYLPLTSATRLDIVLSAAGSISYTIGYLTILD